MPQRKAKKRVIRRRRRLNGLGQPPTQTRSERNTAALNDLSQQALDAKTAAVRAALARKCDLALELHEESARLFGVISNKAKNVSFNKTEAQKALDFLRAEIRNGQEAARLCYLNQPYSLIEVLDKATSARS